jgi:5'-3' exonuclease
MSNTTIVHPQTHPQQQIYVDGSYFVFYRTFATLKWWKLAHSAPGEAEPSFDNPAFLSKFTDLCIKSITEIKKRAAKHFNIPPKKAQSISLVFAKDCPRPDIWRMTLYPDYKSTRVTKEFVKPFFAHFYNFIQSDPHNYKVLHHPHLEADDCIAIATLETNPDTKVLIITSDSDYVQLMITCPNVTIWNLQFKPNPKTNPPSDFKFELFRKIVNGDKSDNIPPLWKKPRTPNDLMMLFVTDSLELYDEIYKSLNAQLINFKYIPEIYKQEFIHQQLAQL